MSSLGLLWIPEIFLIICHKITYRKHAGPHFLWEGGNLEACLHLSLETIKRRNAKPICHESSYEEVASSNWMVWSTCYG